MHSEASYYGVLEGHFLSSLFINVPKNITVFRKCYLLNNMVLTSNSYLTLNATCTLGRFISNLLSKVGLPRHRLSLNLHKDRFWLPTPHAITTGTYSESIGRKVLPNIMFHDFPKLVSSLYI